MSKNFIDLEKTAEELYLSFFREGAMGMTPWIEVAEETKAKYRIATQKIVSSAWLDFTNQIGDDVVYLDEGCMRRVMSVSEMNQCIQFLKDRMHENIRYRNESWTTIIREVVIHKEEKELEGARNLKSFQDDVLIYLRAIALIASSVGDGGTHNEKDARLRGLIGIVESGIKAVKDGARWKISSLYFNYPDLFTSDFPVRQYIQKINELKAENEKLKSGNVTNDDEGGF